MPTPPIPTPERLPTWRPRPIGTASAPALDRAADFALAHGRVRQAELLAELAAELRGAA